MEDTAMAPDVHTENHQSSEVYRVSRTLGTLGQRMKALGLVCGALLLGGSVVLHSTMGTPMPVMVGGILCGGVVGLLLYMLGMQVAAQGERLQATLERAGPSLPYCTPEDRAERMPLHASSPAPGTRPRPPYIPAPASHQQESEAAPTATARRVEQPHHTPTQTLSLKAAAQAIGVTKGTMKGYIKSGRVAVNADETIDPAALSRAGFILRN